jgi:hypothetical protein
MQDTRTADFLVSNHGSIFLLHPRTRAAVEWCEEHLPPEALEGEDFVVVEHRYIRDIVGGAINDGLLVVE